VSEGLEKRTWVYTQPPRDYGMAPCACGNHETQWSEFKGHLWCDKCNIDFKPEHGGVFDGPIPVYTSALLGMRFDRLNLETGDVEIFDPANLSDRSK